MKPKTLIMMLLALVFQLGFSQNTDAFFKSADQFFNNNVKDGKVAYKAIHLNQDELNNLVKMIGALSLSNANANTKQAFYINAYNVLVVKGIIDNYPIKSPLDKSGFFDKISYEVSGESLTLNDIENKKLRAQFGDARFHFVLVCGAIGCPPLINSAYFPSRLDSQLQTQTEIALNNPNFIKVKKNKVQLSEIFKWYKEDFIKDGNELEYINQFRGEKIQLDAKVSYYPYNWSLNQQ